ncbi:hypothetical protein EP7_005568 (plasmid) [Isosphaeraceae bacterium EP7]
MTTTATMLDAPLSETTHPLAVEIVRKACRNFTSSREFHDKIYDIIARVSPYESSIAGP